MAVSIDGCRVSSLGRLTPPLSPYPSLYPLSLNPLPPNPFPIPLPLSALEVSPLNPAKWSGERCKLPQRIWAEPSRRTVFGGFWAAKKAFDES